MKLRLITLLSLSFCLLCTLSFAQANQADFKQFSQSLISQVPLPPVMMNNCVPAICLIKIEVDTVENGVNMQLSDSADSAYVKEFSLRKKNVDVLLLQKYLKENYSNRRVFLIPFSYALSRRRCPSVTQNVATLTKYNKFSGKDFTGNVTMLPPIYVWTDFQQ